MNVFSKKYMNVRTLVGLLIVYYIVQIHAPVRTNEGAIRTAENYIPLDVPATWGAMEKL